MNANEAATARRDEYQKYFVPTPPDKDRQQALIGLIGGGSAALLGLILLVSSPVWGVLFLGGGGYFTYKGFEKWQKYQADYNKAEPKPTDQKMDDRLFSDVSRIAEYGMTRLGLTNDDIELAGSDPISRMASDDAPESLVGPMTAFGPDYGSGYAIGKDGVWRFKQYEVMIICPTNYHLAIYMCVLDFLTGGYRLDATHEYHYADVVAVGTATKPVGSTPQPLVRHDESTAPVRFAATAERRFQIVVSSGDRSTVISEIRNEANPDDGDVKLQTSGIDELITSLRKVLRDKKGGVRDAAE